jgi:hypothetical protein
MKNLIAPVIFFICFSSYAQDSVIAFSPIEKFVIQPNRAIRTEWKEVGQFGSRVIVVLKARDVITGVQKQAIRLNNNNSPVSINAVDASAVYIDSADMEGVINALEYLIAETAKEQKSDSKFTYTTLNDVRIAAAYYKENDNWEFAVNRLYHTQKTPVWFAGFRLNKKSLKELTALLKRLQSEELSGL